ncbi:hypothetical protein [Nitratidesulfovibrio sp. 1201_IL3209]|uniref:hypothetical protein n=1 Tax=Nitratidesulfovibrio sp. 1201_IL3209 TaxID=3084053 RepID=UPI002FDB5ED9
MRITLPCTKQTVTLRSLTRAQAKELLRLERERAALVKASLSGSDEERAAALAGLVEDPFLTRREDMTAGLYPDMNLDAMDNRDAVTLMDATYMYSLNLPEKELKNLFGCGDGTPTPTEPPTAPTA